MREDATIASRILRMAIIIIESSLEFRKPLGPSVKTTSTAFLRKGVDSFLPLAGPREREANDSSRVLLLPTAAQNR